MEEKLKAMLSECSNHHRDKNTLQEYYVSARLEKSTRVYYDQLTQTINYLVKKNPFLVSKMVNKM